MKFEIGKYYRTRGGDKVRLFGIRGDGRLYFEQVNYEGWFATEPDGQFGYNKESDYQIISEWKEQYRHESTVWLTTSEGSIASSLLRHITGIEFTDWSKNKTDYYNRKFKVTVEEILE